MVQETFEIQTIPAIMPASFEDLREKLERVASFVPMVQIDICDGAFTPKPTWPYKSKNNLDAHFEKILKEDQGLPFWDSVNFEIDLMVSNPEEETEKWIIAGASRLIIHVESIEAAKLANLIESLRTRGVEVALAIGTTTSVEELTPYLETVDAVQFMGIDRIGFQGEPFQTSILEKIKRLRQSHPNLHIAVDGGVNLDTAPDIIEAGADRLVAGSAIFESDILEDTLDSFSNLSHF